MNNIAERPKDTYDCLYCGKENSIYSDKGRKKENPMYCNLQCSSEDKRGKERGIRPEDANNVFHMKSFKEWYLRSIEETFLFRLQVRL